MVKWPTSHTRSACSRFWSAWGRCQPLRRTTRGACRNIRATVGKIAIMPPKPTAEAGRRASLTAIAGLADTQVTVTRKMDIQETGMRIAREPAAAAQRGLPRSPKGLLRDHGSRSSARSGRHAVMARLPKATGRTADTVVTPRITPGAAVPIRGTTCHRLSLRSICTDGNTENFHRSRAQNASTALNVCKCSLRRLRHRKRTVMARATAVQTTPILAPDRIIAAQDTAALTTARATVMGLTPTRLSAGQARLAIPGAVTYRPMESARPVLTGGSGGKRDGASRRCLPPQCLLELGARAKMKSNGLQARP